MTTAEVEREFWDELKRLCAVKDIAGFYKKYAEYLEWANIYSDSRQCLYEMALLTVEKMRVTMDLDVIRIARANMELAADELEKASEEATFSDAYDNFVEATLSYCDAINAKFDE